MRELVIMRMENYIQNPKYRQEMINSGVQPLTKADLKSMKDVELLNTYRNFVASETANKIIKASGVVL